jgi:hypothetical protein
LLVSGRDFKSFIHSLSKIAFISFNYDRCIHQFFHFASKSYFLASSDQLKELHENINVIYPYGSIGEFPSPGNDQSFFGSVSYGSQLVERSQRIKTFTEGAASDEHSNIRTCLEEANTFVFLGFGFLKLNMELLFGQIESRVTRVFGTCMGLSDDSKQEVERRHPIVRRSRPNYLIVSATNFFTSLIEPFRKSLLSNLSAKGQKHLLLSL